MRIRAVVSIGTVLSNFGVRETEGRKKEFISRIKKWESEKNQETLTGWYKKGGKKGFCPGRRGSRNTRHKVKVKEKQKKGHKLTKDAGKNERGEMGTKGSKESVLPQKGVKRKEVSKDPQQK